MGFTLLCILLGAFLYHCGGLGKDRDENGNLKEDPWIPVWLRHSWVRDWVIPGVNLALLFTWWHPVRGALIIVCLLSYAIQAAALSTYWDWVNELLYLPEEDKLWFNWFLHGAGVGVAFFPLITQGIHWYAVLASSLATGFVMMVISERTSRSNIEEWGRGAVAIAGTLLLIF